MLGRVYRGRASEGRVPSGPQSSLGTPSSARQNAAFSQGRGTSCSGLRDTDRGIELGGQKRGRRNFIPARSRAHHRARSRQLAYCHELSARG
eukprot:6920297-Prymnesium_polylepis.1